MAKRIVCDCGYVVRADTADELVAAAEEHMRDVHPDVAGHVSTADLLATAEDVD